MAKKSNKKNRRQKQAIKIDRIHKEEARRHNADSFDRHLVKEKERPGNFYRWLRIACLNPMQVEVEGYSDGGDWRGDYQPTAERLNLPDSDSWEAVRTLAATLKNMKCGDDESRTVARLIEISRRAKFLRNSYSAKAYTKAFVHIARWKWMWLRKPEEWKPRSKNSGRQFSEFIRYLFCRYDVPEFMDKAWTEEYNDDSDKHQKWFVNLGMGANIRKQEDLPIKLTKKMAHLFTQAPSNLNITEAFRWAQVVAMGGDDRTARAVIATHLGRHFENDDFWVTVIQFFINNPLLDSLHYGPIYDYIDSQRFVARGDVLRDGQIQHLGPPNPDFSMQHRDPNALLRQVDEWHRRMNRRGSIEQQVAKSWDSCGIKGLEIEEKETAWIIRELTTSIELWEEGDKMSHCVGSYASSCAVGSSAIFSLIHLTEEKTTTELTIEVTPKSKHISQARKKCNAKPNKEDLRIMKMWAKERGLTISNWITE